MPLEYVGAPRRSSAVAGAGTGSNPCAVFTCPAAHIERRTRKLVDSQQLESDRRAHNVYNRIHRAHFVEMHFLDGHLMHVRFGFAQAREDFLRAFSGPRRKSRASSIMP
jgi:hypothetical protein